LNKRKLYWICQITGWGSLVAIETINYTFFIVGKFNLEYFAVFSYCSIIGLISTHIFKNVLKRTTIFERPKTAIWLIALISTFMLSVWLTTISFVPTLITGAERVMESINFIGIFGSIVNWMRYVAVWVIIYFMYRILERNRFIEQEKLQSENIARLTELELLKTQLNPHFLFNALNSIKALVTLDPDKSKDAIVKLSELLRFTLNYGLQPLIPLHDEILEVKKYLSLEQIRFGERFQVVYEVAENSLNKMIPPALILTLAENSIKHGIANQSGTCTLTIKTHSTENAVLIETINPGTLTNGFIEGIGLRNIRKRLASLFANKATFSITEKEGVVHVSINIQLA
jgi:two-component system, LytTR family, sensor kinase